MPELTSDHDPRDLIGGDQVVVVLGGGLYADERRNSADRRVALLAWADTEGVEATGLATLYSSPDASEEDGENDEAATDDVVDDSVVHSALPLIPDSG